MAETDHPWWRLRAVTLALLLAVQLGALVLGARIRGSDLAHEDWTGAVMLAGLASLPPAGPPDAVGSVELYGDGTILVLTALGLEEIRVDAETVITRPAATAGMSDLRPGVAVAAWGHRPLWGDGMTARALLVLGE